MENLSKNTKGNNANTLLCAVLVYFIEYDWVGYKRHCQIEAHSETEARDIFQRRFDYCCRITKIETTEDIADEVSDKLIGVIRSQMNCT
jgi:hypothetical protein